MKGTEVDRSPDRLVLVGEPQTVLYCDNSIKTSKYEWWNFLPKFLMEEFNPRTKFANCYFLMICGLQVVPQITNTGGYPTTLIPLLGVLLIAGVLKAVEDYQRHKADKAANSSITEVLDRATNQFVRKKWSEVAVGDFIRVKSRQVIPADVLIVQVWEPNPELPKGSCYIETKSLDGETNLKHRAVLSPLLGKITSEQSLLQLHGKIVMEHPNSLIDHFTGVLELSSDSLVTMDLPVSSPTASSPATSSAAPPSNSNSNGNATVPAAPPSSTAAVSPSGGSGSSSRIPISSGNVILRGCVLRSTDFMIGFVMNTGHDVKIMQSKVLARVKSSKLEYLATIQLVGIVLLLLFLCLCMSVAQYNFNQYWDIRSFWYLDWTANAGTTFVIRFFATLLLHATFVPVALYVSMALLRFGQAFFMQWDLAMYYEDKDLPMTVRTMNLNEELGQITHIFSDKTGTLTSNNMNFRKASIGGFSYGKGITEIGKAAWRLQGKTIPPEVLEAEELASRSTVPHVSFYCPDFDRDYQSHYCELLLQQQQSPMTTITTTNNNNNSNTNSNNNSKRASDKSPRAGAGTSELELGTRKNPNNTSNSNSINNNNKKSNPRHSINQNHNNHNDNRRQQASVSTTSHSNTAGRGRNSSNSNNSNRSPRPQSQTQARPSSATVPPPPASSRSLKSALNTASATATASSTLPNNNNNNTATAIAIAAEQQNHLSTTTSTSTINTTPASASSSSPQRERIKDFYRFLSVCHEVIPERLESGEIKLSAPNPDDEALVCAAGFFGYAFLDRRDRFAVVQDEESRQALEIEILYTIPFSSSRRRMSVIIRDIDHKIKILTKGADSMILSRCDPNDLEINRLTAEHVNAFSHEGLRCLMLAMAVIEEENFQGWSKHYDEANTDLSELEKKKRGEENDIEELEDLIERGLHIVGATAIEDRLQEGVPETIETLLQAGFKVWILTGDKEETAINIGVACNLLLPEEYMDHIIVNLSKAPDVKKAAHLLKREIARYMKETREAASASVPSEEKDYDHLTYSLEDVSSKLPPGCKPRALIIDGPSLIPLMKEAKYRNLLLLFTQCCQSVVCCRVSPDQKREIQDLVKDNLPDVRTLAIGDGANDVAMITSAHIGVGIKGEEGVQAVNASDYAIGRFRFLSQLLLKHGRYNYIRMSTLMVFMLYKNIFMSLSMYWYNFFSGYSNAKFFTEAGIQFYNLFYTSLPIVLYGFMDQDLHPEILFHYPQIYDCNRRDDYFNFTVVWHWIFHAFIESAFVSVFSLYLLQNFDVRGGGVFASHMEAGALVFTAVVIIVNLKLFLFQRNWTKVHLAVIVLSISLWIGIAFAANVIELVDYNFYYVWSEVMRSGEFFLSLLLLVAAVGIKDLIWATLVRYFFYRPYHILQEMDQTESYLPL